MPAFGRRAVRLLWLPVLLSVVAGWSSTAVSAASGAFGKDVVAGWVELGPDAAVIARAITRASSCPALRVDGATQAMAERARPSVDFPVLSCEATLPRHARSVILGDGALPLPPPSPRRVLVIGDTGCRQKGTEIQDCTEPGAWPFARVAKKAAALRPDLIIHVGDLHYRETPCPPPPDSTGCQGEPFGDNWAAWEADFFAPAAPLLAAAPWIIVRGDHELCSRGGQGWTRFLDPYPLAPDCADYSPPYQVAFGDWQLVVFDVSNANDTAAQDVPAYAEQFEAVRGWPLQNAWFLTHKPIWGLAQGDDVGPTDPRPVTFNATLQEAIAGKVPEALRLVLSGHVHVFEYHDFGVARPVQVIVGNSGTKLDAPIQPPTAGTVIDELPIRQGFLLSRFGYVALERGVSGDWRGILFDVQGTEVGECRIEQRNLFCKA